MLNVFAAAAEGLQWMVHGSAGIVTEKVVNSMMLHHIVQFVCRKQYKYIIYLYIHIYIYLFNMIWLQNQINMLYTDLENMYMGLFASNPVAIDR